MTEISRKTVAQANMQVHKILANTYDEEQPHYRSENKVAVTSRLARLATEAGDQTLVDFGCGTGFIIQLAVPYFYTIYGVDITRDMLQKIDLSSEKVKLLEANTESVPLISDTANVITANSFLHHLYNIQPTIAEAYRLLKPGGVFYSEEYPNAFFWESLIITRSNGVSRNCFGDVQRELSATLETHMIFESTLGLDARIVQLAENPNMILGGMRVNDLERLL